jgi:hypothetical protein
VHHTLLFISPAVSSQNILKHKRPKKPTHQCITTQIITNYRPFSRELFLKAADENANRFNFEINDLRSY